jgi:hypothetical protein
MSSRGKRFDDSLIKRTKEEPGPGQYETITTFNKEGKFFVNKIKNSGAPIFSKARRILSLDNS